MKEKLLYYIKIILVIFILIFCIINTDIINKSIYNALMRCINIIIPSLYAMMIISPLFIRSGIVDGMGRFTGGIGRIIFGMDSVVFPVFVFSMTAGYPVGVKMLYSAYVNKSISKKRAEVFSGVCFGAGTAFISGCIAGQLYGNKSAGKIILISTVGANIMTAFVISFFMRGECGGGYKKSRIKITSSMLNECVIDGGRSIMNICFMIMAFSVVTAVLDYTGIISGAGKYISRITGLSAEDSGQLIRAFLDVTAVEGFPHGDYSLLPYLSALVSFGGICVIFQISAVSGDLSLKPLILIRIISSIISYNICKIITPMIYEAETIAVSSVNIRTYQASSPVPSVMLIIMTVFLMHEYEKLPRTKRGDFICSGK